MRRIAAIILGLMFCAVALATIGFLAVAPIGSATTQSPLTPTESQTPSFEFIALLVIIVLLVALLVVIVLLLFAVKNKKR